MSISSLSALSANLGTITAASLTLGSSGYVRQGQTAYNTGTGFWLGDVGGTAKLSFGSPSGHRLTWDGTSLIVSAMVVSPIVFVGSGTVLLNNSGNNYNTIAWNGAGTSVLLGITNGVTGQSVTLSNRQGNSATLTVDHNPTGNGFLCPGGIDAVLNVGGSLTAQFDGTSWYVISVNLG